MIEMKNFIRVIGGVGCGGGLVGCSPVWQVGGAYFPAWLICAVGGVVGAVVLRAVLFGLQMESWLRPRAVVYPSAGVFFALVIYWIFFTR